MKKITLLKSALLLCALVAGSGSVWAEDTYVKVTSESELTIGGVYIFVAEKSGTYYLGSGDYAKRITAVTSGFSVSGSTVTITTATPYTVVLGGTSGAYTMKYDATNYMGKASANTEFATSTSTSDNTMTWRWNNGGFYSNYKTNDKDHTGRYIGGNATNKYIGPYNDTSNYPIAGVYKKVVPLSIPSSGYASLVSSDKLDFSGTIANLNAPYKATAATSGSGVTLTSMSGVVAASTPMIIKGTGSKTAYIPITSAAATADATGNLLSGSATAAQDIDANEAYILMGGKFCLVTAASSVPAGKAYLLASKVDGGANELTFVIDEENSGTTGIEKTIVNKATDGQIYNLAGQRIAQPTKGLFIVNGKKVIVK